MTPISGVSTETAISVVLPIALAYLVLGVLVATIWRGARNDTAGVELRYQGEPGWQAAIWLAAEAVVWPLLVVETVVRGPLRREVSRWRAWLFSEP